jgi:hypothetical protein
MTDQRLHPLSPYTNPPPPPPPPPQHTRQGDIKDLVRQGEQRVNASAGLRSALGNYMSYVMAIQYAASFGVELVVFNMAASYFHDEFRADVTEAGKIAMLCGVRVFAGCSGPCAWDVDPSRQTSIHRSIPTLTLLPTPDATTTHTQPNHRSPTSSRAGWAATSRTAPTATRR